MKSSWCPKCGVRVRDPLSTPPPACIDENGCRVCYLTRLRSFEVTDGRPFFPDEKQFTTDRHTELRKSRVKRPSSVDHGQLNAAEVAQLIEKERSARMAGTVVCLQGFYEHLNDDEGRDRRWLFMRTQTNINSILWGLTTQAMEQSIEDTRAYLMMYLAPSEIVVDSVPIADSGRMMRVLRTRRHGEKKQPRRAGGSVAINYFMSTTVVMTFASHSGLYLTPTPSASPAPSTPMDVVVEHHHSLVDDDEG